MWHVFNDLFFEKLCFMSVLRLLKSLPALAALLLGSVLTGYNLDDSGLWLGPPLEVPPHKDEL